MQGVMKVYVHKRKVDVSYQQAVERVKAELSLEGFGVLTEIDVAATLKKKLDIDYGAYIILGACNPQFAYRALQADRDIGAMLPCNVIVYVDSGKTHVACILPSVQMAKTENGALCGIAEQVEEKLKAAIDRV